MKMSWDEREAAVDGAFGAVPANFGLKGFPGDVFHINRASSYVDVGGVIQLYIYTGTGKGVGSAFCKATPAELQEQITEISEEDS